eukprot:4434539-Prymnesium_polylepis.2
MWRGEKESGSVAWGNRLYRFCRSRSIHAGMDSAVSSLRGTDGQRGCEAEALVAFRSEKGSSSAPEQHIVDGAACAHHGREHCGPDCSAAEGPPTTPFGQA